MSSGASFHSLNVLVYPVRTDLDLGHVLESESAGEKETRKRIGTVIEAEIDSEIGKNNEPAGIHLEVNTSALV